MRWTLDLSKRKRILLERLEDLKKERNNEDWIELGEPVFVNKMNEYRAELCWHVGGGRFYPTGYEGLEVSLKNLRKNKNKIYIKKNIYEYHVRI